MFEAVEAERVSPRVGAERVSPRVGLVAPRYQAPRELGQAQQQVGEGAGQVHLYLELIYPI